MSIPVFSIHGLIAWLETQDPETEYLYVSSQTCLLTKYFRSRGIKRKGVYRYGPLIVYSLNEDEHVNAPQWDKIAIGHPRTYGAALARAKETI